MSRPVSFSELIDAYHWVNAAPLGSNGAYVSRDSGRIYWEGDLDPGDQEEAPPSDIHDPERYASVPHKNDLDLGQQLVFGFVRAKAPEAHDEVREIFRSRGAYGRFKGFLQRRDLVRAWHQYQEEALAEALRGWAQGEGLELTGSP